MLMTDKISSDLFSKFPRMAADAQIERGVVNMKVLIINTVRFRLNGITSVIMNYYRNMDKQGVQTDFVVVNEISQEYRRDGCHIHLLPRKKNPLAYMFGLFRLLRRNRYDIVHIHGNSAMMLFDVLPAKLAGVPVRIVHSHSTSCSHMKLHKLLLPIFRKCYTHGFACGQEAGAWLFEQGPFVELKNGINLRSYCYNESSRNKFRDRIHAGDRMVIGHVGYFAEVKNHTFMLDWYAKLSENNDDYLLLLIGEGALMELMKQKAEQLNLQNKVLFLGKTTEVPGYLQAMDAFVLPSLHEGLPVVLVEAQAAGLPCYVSDKVSRQADLTNSLEFLTIEDASAWSQRLANDTEKWKNLDRQLQCSAWQRMIAKEGYDVACNADILKHLYESYVSEARK